MKNVKIVLHKDHINFDIDNETYKRVDATLDQASDRSQNALSSDTEEDNDGALIARFRDRRDARLRKALAFCLKKNAIEDGMVIDNNPDSEKDYIYELSVEDDFTVDQLRGVSTLMHEYIVRGSIYDWYLHAGVNPTDSAETIEELEDTVASQLRGRPWGRLPMQPFDPRYYKY